MKIISILTLTLCKWPNYTSEKGVQFQCQSLKLFRIPYNCTFSLLNDKVCSALDLLNTKPLKNIYYLQPTLIKQGQLTCYIIHISTDVHLHEMIACKSHFLMNTINDLYAKLTRSTKQVMTLLNQPTLTSSTNPNANTFGKIILYFKGITQRVIIMKSPHGYNLTYRCNNLKTMTTNIISIFINCYTT